MKQLFLLLSIAYCSLFTTAASAQQWGWINRVYENTDLSITYPKGMDVDAQGNIYYSSAYLTTPVFPNAVTLNAPSINKLQTSLCKVSPTGSYLWTRRLNGPSISSGTHCLANGNVANFSGFVSGVGNTSYTFNGITYNKKYSGTTGNCFFFLIYDKDGNELYSKNFQYKTNVTSSNEVSCCSGNDLYYVTCVYDTLWYDNTFIAMPAGTNRGLFRIKVSGITGDVTEVLRLGTGHSTTVNFPYMDAIVNENGETYMFIQRIDAYDFGNGITIPAAGGRKEIYAKFDASGKALWAFNTTQAQGTGADYVSYRNAFTLDENNNLYAAIGYSNQIEVNGTVYTSPSTDVNNHIILSLDNATGKIRHVSHFNKSSGVHAPDDGIRALKSNGKGFIYAVGTTTGMEHFGDFYYQNDYPQGPYTYVNNPNKAICFLFKIDTSGVVNKFRFFGSATTDDVASHVTAFGDKAYVGVRSKIDMYFDNPSLTVNFDAENPAYAFDAVLAAFEDCNAQISVSGNVLTASSGAAYQWYLNGTAIDGETNQTYSLPVNTQGNYTVQVTFAGGCVSRSATLPVKQVVTGTVGASAFTALAAYPNPTADQLTLAVSNPGKGATVNLTIYNTEGQQMMMAQYPNWSAESEYVTNVKDFPQGLYFVKMVCGEQSLNAKFIKQ